MAGNVVIRQVWQHNLEEEFERMTMIIPTHRYTGIYTEFPGLSEMAKMARNVRETKLIQLGMCFMDDTESGNPLIWEFNFRDFNPQTDIQVAASVDVVTRSGIDLQLFMRDGIRMADFIPLFRDCGVLADANRRWVVFQGEYDFGYLLKAAHEGPLPDTEQEFFPLLRRYFPSFFDMKYISNELLWYSPKFGLNDLAKAMQVERGVGQLSHSATLSKGQGRKYARPFTPAAAPAIHQNSVRGIEIN